MACVNAVDPVSVRREVDVVAEPIAGAFGLGQGTLQAVARRFNQI